MSKVALVAFKGTVAQKVIELCFGFDKFYVDSNLRGIEKLVGSGELESYDRIVALGLKNRSKDAFVHVEGVALLRGKILPLDTGLSDGVRFQKTKIHASLEKSWCNILAAQLRAKYPKKSVAFLHIPPKTSVIEVSEYLNGKL
jgi:hypothetical protein